jgi:hypothetical protein
MLAARLQKITFGEMREPRFVCAARGKRGAEVRLDFNWGRPLAPAMGYQNTNESMKGSGPSAGRGAGVSGAVVLGCTYLPPLSSGGALLV